MKLLVKLQPNEVEVLIKNKLHYNLYQASRNKRKQGKTYYCNNDDFPVLKVVSKMRKMSVKDILSNLSSY